MSNFNSYIREQSRKMRGISKGDRVLGNPTATRARQQVIFEQRDELLKSLGGSTDPGTTLKAGNNKKFMKSRKRQDKFMRKVNARLLKQSLLK